VAAKGVSVIPTLQQAVLSALAAEGPIPVELRRLAIDRAARAEIAIAHVVNVRPLGSAARTVAERVACRVREEHAAGVKVRVCP
jgi:hypothetical protein